jgi:hypothetical protein
MEKGRFTGEAERRAWRLREKRGARGRAHFFIVHEIEYPGHSFDT